MAKRQKLFTIDEAIAERLDRQIGSGYRSGFVERAIRDRLDETTTPEQVSLKWLYVQLLLHDEATIELKNLARWYLCGNHAYQHKDGHHTVFDPIYHE